VFFDEQGRESLCSLQKWEKGDFMEIKNLREIFNGF